MRVTVPKEIVSDSPKVEDRIDERAVAEHYGLSTSTGPGIRGPRRGPRPAEEERARVREGDEQSSLPGSSPALLGDRLAGHRRTGPGSSARRMEAAARQRGEQVVATRLLVVPGERDLAHQVRVRLLEARVVAQRHGEAADAALAADAGHLDRLGLD